MKTHGEFRLYTSRLIGDEVFWHGFPERFGGVSTDERSSLNLGHRWGDAPRTSPAIARSSRSRSVSTSTSWWLQNTSTAPRCGGLGSPNPKTHEFDGLVSTRPGYVLGAFAADCIPLVFANEQARVCGAAHAGWRGTVGRVAVNVVEKMVSAGADRENIRVALGPSIGPCCFEVGPEVVDEFVKGFGAVDGLVVQGPKKEHINRPS